MICSKRGVENAPKHCCGRCGAPLSQQELAKGTVEIEELKNEVNELKALLKGVL